MCRASASCQHHPTLPWSLRVAGAAGGRRSRHPAGRWQVFSQHILAGCCGARHDLLHRRAPLCIKTGCWFAGWLVVLSHSARTLLMAGFTQHWNDGLHELAVLLCCPAAIRLNQSSSVLCPLQPCPPCTKSCWPERSRTTLPPRRRRCALSAPAGMAHASRVGWLWNWSVVELGVNGQPCGAPQAGHALFLYIAPVAESCPATAAIGVRKCAPVLLPLQLCAGPRHAAQAGGGFQGACAGGTYGT